ncbi:hypothetical protein SynA1825c_02374 [Synechococcus sp. A18-25c]|nr:hypothetical protein SynA1825c_02374 [Synechococcus sp. A18-25c]
MALSLQSGLALRDQEGTDRMIKRSFHQSRFSVSAVDVA